MCEITYTPQLAAAQTVVQRPRKRGRKLGSRNINHTSLSQKQAAMRAKIAKDRTYNSYKEQKRRRRTRLRYSREYDRNRQLVLKMDSYLLKHVQITQEELDAEREFNRLHAVETSCSYWREFNKFILTS